MTMVEPVDLPNSASPSKQQSSTDTPPSMVSRPRHVLMRLRRISTPAALSSRHPSEEPDIHQAMASDRRHLQESGIPIVPFRFAPTPSNTKRLSTTSIRSCTSLPEENEDSPESARTNDRSTADVVHQRATLQAPASAAHAQLRIRRVSKRTSLSKRPFSTAGPTSEALRLGHERVQRPVSMALPTTSVLLATKNVQQRTAYSTDTVSIVRSVPSAPNLGRKASQTRPSVHFSTSTPTLPSQTMTVEEARSSLSRSIIPPEAFATAKRNARAAKRDRIANEFLLTERVYVQGLEDTKRLYLDPLTESAACTDPSRPPILPSKTIKEIFANFVDILTLGREVLKMLEEGSSVTATPVAVQRSPISMGSLRSYRPPESMEIPQNIGATLAPILPFLKCYSMFVQNFAHAQKVIDQGDKHNDRWRAFVASRKSHKGSGAGLGLLAMLLCIVQRIPRYGLLLGVSPAVYQFSDLRQTDLNGTPQDLVRYTDIGHPDYPCLVEARRIVAEGEFRCAFVPR